MTPCPSCAFPRVTRLSLTLTDGTPAVFESCARCGHRAWTTFAGPVPVGDVITRMTRPAGR